MGRFTKEEIEMLIHLYKQGLSYEEIGNKLNRSKGSINQKLINIGITKNDGRVRKYWSEEEIKSINRLHLKGVDYKEISIVLNRSKSTTWRKMLEMGLIKKENHIYEYEIDDIANESLLIIKQTRHPDSNKKSYIVQSLKYPKAPNYMILENDLLNGIKDAYLLGRRIFEGNSLYSIESIRPHLVDIEYSKTIAPTHSKKISFRCTDCNTEKKSTPRSVVTQGFSCSKCSKNTSYPELFFMAYLEVKNIKHEHQVKFDNSLRRIDFKIELNNTIYYIECNGIQHYKEINNGSWGNVHEETVKSDELKREYAKNNNVNLIELDCSKSDFEFIENSIEKCKFLPNIEKRDVNNMTEIIKRNKKYNIKGIMDDYQEGLTSYDLGKKYNMSPPTVINILRKNGIMIKKRNDYK